MIATWLELPLVFRYAIIASVGLLLGVFANWGIYTFAYYSRPISPWSPPHPEAGRRRWADRIPIIGWLSLRRERSLHGNGFWVRPMLIELCLPILACLLYQYQAVDFRLIDPKTILAFQGQPNFGAVFGHWMNYLFLGHLLLMTLMLMATFIDFDERTVPDYITVPGTLLGLVLAAISFELFLPHTLSANNQQIIEPTVLTSPLLITAWLKSVGGLWFGLAMFAGWCFAIADRRIILRKGWSKAVEFFLAGLVRNPSWKLLVAIWLCGSAGIAGVWFWDETHWLSLLTSLAGMTVGGGSVWAVRIFASHALRQEAMGFGDVTLMAMIGAFIGWQASLIAFALAPMTAILIVIVQYIVTRNRVVAFGPYLCAGTAVTVIYWSTLWDQFGEAAFGLGPQILFTILGSLLLCMWAMLLIWGWIKRTLLGIG